MTITYDATHRGWTQGSTHGAVCLQDKFEILKDIGDGSFGSVTLARVRNGGSHIARRGTLVAIKTMKKTFESFGPCLELREIIFLRTLPIHQHLVPALDIFLDPLSNKLHIAMEYMDGNLYQLMKARDHKPFDGSSVKSILFQILSGLEHIHDHGFFHRDIKPENILVSVSAREDIGSAFKRYSQLVTPPSTPPSYTIKLADFGLAREMNSRLPFTTYVSTRWYRAPEVLLRAGEYSAPVDIWAIGAMAVEIATLKPLFPGGNEVDQVWRVCEIMGSPGNWVNKQGQRVGGGEWKDGVKLAQKLGFSFPKMAPHTLDTILTPPQWSPALTDFVTWCLMWDPKGRPTSAQSLAHEYFVDAIDPLRPKSSASRLLSRKHADQPVAPVELGQTLTSRTSSWFRKSVVARESVPSLSQSIAQNPITQTISPQPSPVKPDPIDVAIVGQKPLPLPPKRATWNNGAAPPMPILPSIRPVSPLSNAVTAQAQSQAQVDVSADSRTSKKIGRQLSVASNGNHYSDAHRHDAERALSGQSGLMSPSNGQKESFFSHLRKRARRLSGRQQLPSGNEGDLESGAGYVTSTTNRGTANDMVIDQDPASKPEFADLDRALQSVRYSLEASQNAAGSRTSQHQSQIKAPQRMASNPTLKRHHSLPPVPLAQALPVQNLTQSRSMRRAAHKPTLPTSTYETPDEQEELLDEALSSAHIAAAHLDRRQNRASNFYADTGRHALRQTTSEMVLSAPYPSPSPSTKRNSGVYSQSETKVQPIDIHRSKQQQPTQSYPFPTPPYEENEWAAAAAASIAAAGDQFR